ncbi:hypothetical protein MKZ38_003185 [Zalerion maritima]|uniref:Protein-serine/threonine kinase n=1 Tax=Zalerion maritima TaxID=339359 RepID=A0AAD5S104_9PEZI|nr:hypothetical protein MKZ38_003185 [Zalerion maritima]
MPIFIVSCKDGISKDQVEAVKEQAKSQGGTIKHEYALINAFSVEFPEGHVSTMDQHEHVKAVEADQEVRTQISSGIPYTTSSLRQYSSHQPHHKSSHKGHGPYDRKPIEEVISCLANKHQHPLSLADLVRLGPPPLSSEALFQSANFTLSLLPIRLAYRLQALRNLPFIVVSNPNITKIHDNYRHSLGTLLPWEERTISNPEDEVQFTSVLSDLVKTHQDTIPILARGFLECRKYISAGEITRFLDEHLRTRIGTRLIAEQHIALHNSSVSSIADKAEGATTSKEDLEDLEDNDEDDDSQDDQRSSKSGEPEQNTYIGVIDTALQPAVTIDSAGGFVADICELKYGVRPQWVIDGEPDTTFAFVPMHLDYIVTELLKNAFRATVESRSKEPVVITIAPEPPAGPSTQAEKEVLRRLSEDAILPLDDKAPGVTIRIRDRGGGIRPDVLPNIWGYSFTTFSEEDDVPGGSDAFGMLSGAGGSGSSIAGLGYGLPLSRAYAEYFGGGIAVQSLYGWGTDVYLRLKGVGSMG